jgi:purine-nucleoside/S-methyl-5'-thioadenosine phosphorylase / adenosine deaminase
MLHLGHTRRARRATGEANRRGFFEALGAGGMQLVALRQVHSSVVHVVAAAPDRPLRGDALVSAAPRLMLAVETADCVPILLADTRRRAVAAVHAGWRGTLARVAEKALGRLRMHVGTDPADVMAAIGPAIGPCCYEVGPEVVQAYLGQFAAAKEWFAEPPAERVNPDGSAPSDWLKREPPGHGRPEQRPHLDLVAANRSQLVAGGVSREKIFAAGLCTACQRDWLFSYRRDGPGAGRMMAAIGLRGLARRRTVRGRVSAGSPRPA